MKTPCWRTAKTGLTDRCLLLVPLDHENNSLERADRYANYWTHTAYHRLSRAYLVSAGRHVRKYLCGSLKTEVTHREGHEQITGFGIVGDTLVSMALLGRYSCEVIALEDSAVRVMPFDLLEMLCREARDYSTAAFMLKMTSVKIGRDRRLKLETVSRAMTKVQRRRLLHACGKDLRILDIDGLRKLATDVGPASFSGATAPAGIRVRA
jgi:hypothetical protein